MKGGRLVVLVCVLFWVIVLSLYSINVNTIGTLKPVEATSSDDQYFVNVDGIRTQPEKVTTATTTDEPTKTPADPKQILHDSQICKMEQRKKLLDDYCRRNYPGSRKTYLQKFEDGNKWPHKSRGNLMVEDTHKLILCKVPKIASTAWKTFLLKATGLWANQSLDGFFESNNPAVRSLIHCSPKETARRLKHYTKVLTVRHPLDRLVSAYRDKFIHDQFEVHIRAYIIDHFRLGVKTHSESAYKDSLKSWKKGNHTADPFMTQRWVNYYNYTHPASDNPLTVTFNEFLRYVISSVSKRNANEHWDSIHHHCSPCNVTYDVIMKLDTIERDTGILMDKMAAVASLHGQTSFTTEHVHRQPHVTPHMMTSPLTSGYMYQNSGGSPGIQTWRTSFTKALPEYTEVPVGLLKRVIDTFREDFLMFGYDMDVDKGVAMCNYMSANSTACC